MTNAELIAALRECEYCNVCSIAVDGNCQFGGRDALEVAAADALEAAEQRIAELEAQLPKEGKWIHGRELGKEWVYDHWVTYFEDWRCSNCGVVFEQESEPKYHYCPNCGRVMKGRSNSRMEQEGER